MRGSKNSVESANAPLRSGKSRRAERAPTLEELVAEITPENRHEEIQWGPDVGKEIIDW
jgi:antitoxin MazE